MIDNNKYLLFFLVFPIFLTLLTNAYAGEWNYYLHDHLGNTRVVLDEQGDVKEYYDYHPFGKIMPGRSLVSGEQPATFKYTGKELDDENALEWYYFGARYYDAEIGRFLVVDPHADSYPSWSPYAYSFDNPLRFIDPTGMDPKDPDDEEKKFSFLENIQNKFTSAISNLFSTTKEAAKETPATVVEMAMDAANQLNATAKDAPAYGIRMLEVSGTTADLASTSLNTLAAAATVAGQPEIAAPAFALGRAADLTSLGTKTLLALADYNKYGGDAKVQLGTMVTGAAIGRTFIGNVGFNTRYYKELATGARPYISNVRGTNSFLGKSIINYGLDSVKKKLAN